MGGVNRTIEMLTITRLFCAYMISTTSQIGRAAEK